MCPTSRLTLKLSCSLEQYSSFFHFLRVCVIPGLYGAGIKPRASCLLGKPSTSWNPTLPPFLELLTAFLLCVFKLSISPFSLLSHIGENVRAQWLGVEEALCLHCVHPCCPSHPMWWTRNNVDPSGACLTLQNSQRKCLLLSETSPTSLFRQ